MYLLIHSLSYFFYKFMQGITFTKLEIMNSITINENWTPASIKMIQNFFLQHLPGQNNTPHEIAVLVGLLQMMRNQFWGRPIFDPANNYGLGVNNLQTCLVLLIPYDKDSPDEIRFCTLAKFADANDVIDEPCSMVEKYEGSDTERKLILTTNEIVSIESLRNIVRMEQREENLIVHMQDDAFVCMGRTIDEFDTMLAGGNFIRVHAAHLINLEHVFEFHPKDGFFLLKNGLKVRLAKDRKKTYVRI